MCNDLGVNFALGFAKMFSAGTFETYLSYRKAIYIAATDDYILLLV